MRLVAGDFIKRVKVTNRGGAGVFTGVLVGFKPGKFAINKLVIFNSQGGAIASKVDTSRWFTTENCDVVLENTPDTSAQSPTY